MDNSQEKSTLLWSVFWCQFDKNLFHFVYQNYFFNCYFDKISYDTTDLDDQNSKIRAVFIVQVLREGWNVLSLYDLVHFDLNGDKKVQPLDMQLVGRGAWYFLFTLPENTNEQDEIQI